MEEKQTKQNKPPTQSWTKEQNKSKTKTNNPPPKKKKKAFETNQAKIVVNDNHFAWHLVTKDPTLVCLPCIPCH